MRYTLGQAWTNVCVIITHHLEGLPPLGEGVQHGLTQILKSQLIGLLCDTLIGFFWHKFSKVNVLAYLPCKISLINEFWEWRKKGPRGFVAHQRRHVQKKKEASLRMRGGRVQTRQTHPVLREKQKKKRGLVADEGGHVQTRQTHPVLPINLGACPNFWKVSARVHVLCASLFLSHTLSRCVCVCVCVCVIYIYIYIYISLYRIFLKSYCPSTCAIYKST